MKQGRSGRKVYLTSDYVIKEMVAEDAESLAIMDAFDECFVPILHIGLHEYVMQRGHEIPLEDKRASLVAGFRLLKHHLWSTEIHCRHDRWWEILLPRIKSNIEYLGLSKQRVLNHISNAANFEIGASHVCHGDPTFENIVVSDTGEVRWIDPIHKKYTPNNRAVDVGKGMQSAWQFEEVERKLTDEPKLDEKLLADLLDISEVPEKVAKAWFVIHVLRFIPYVDKRTAAIYQKVLKDAYV